MQKEKKKRETEITLSIQDQIKISIQHKENEKKKILGLRNAFFRFLPYSILLGRHGYFEGCGQDQHHR